MLKVNYYQWNDHAQSLRHQALTAVHPRTRERFMALYEITQGKNATQIASKINRRPHTVMDWVPAYNERGGGALLYQRSGGRSPLCH